MKTATLTAILVVTTMQYYQVNCVIPLDVKSQILNLIVQKMGIIQSLKQPILPKIIAVINPKLSKIFRAKHPTTTIATNFDDTPYAPPVMEYGPPALPPVEYGPPALYAPPAPAPYEAPAPAPYEAPAPPPIEYGAVPAPPPTEYGAAPAPPPNVYGAPPSPQSSDFGVEETPLPTK